MAHANSTAEVPEAGTIVESIEFRRDEKSSWSGNKEIHS